MVSVVVAVWYVDRLFEDFLGDSIRHDIVPIVQ